MKLTYQEIMEYVRHDKPKITPARKKVIMQALETSDLDESRKEFERVTVQNLEEVSE